jgi:hypothetical protein
MSEEEPAWRAELERDIARSLIASGIHEIRSRVMARDAVLPPVWAAIQAAEQRGREEALKERVDGLKADWARFRGRVLSEAWEAMRDAEGGPLIDAMSVINGLLERS